MNLIDCWPLAFVVLGIGVLWYERNKAALRRRAARRRGKLGGNIDTYV